MAWRGVAGGGAARVSTGYSAGGKVTAEGNLERRAAGRMLAALCCVEPLTGPAKTPCVPACLHGLYRHCIAFRSLLPLISFSAPELENAWIHFCFHCHLTFVF